MTQYQQLNRHQNKVDVHKSSCVKTSSSPSGVNAIIPTSSTCTSSNIPLGTHVSTPSTAVLSLSNISPGIQTGSFFQSIDQIFFQECYLIFVLLTFFVKCIGLTAQNSSLSGSVNSNGNNNNLSGVSGIRECAGCCKRITERFLLKALDLYWHEDCLKCGCCDCRLGEVGSTLYTKANLILCKRDYLR